MVSLLADVFPGISYKPVNLDTLKEVLSSICKERLLVDGELWMEKAIQLYQIQNIHHGLMMVGPSGSGKSSAWKILLAALERIEGVESQSYIIDPKAVSKEGLYGELDLTTREWTDGLFTGILRKIIDNMRGESSKRHWIVFDGDVDPEWVENLNSVLDDSRLLTLPNGERLSLPSNVRIMFEVDTLRYATLATVSRCGMVWFSENVISLEMLFDNYLMDLCAIPRDEEEDAARAGLGEAAVESDTLKTQREIADVLRSLFVGGGMVEKVLEFAAGLEHIMDFTRMRVISTLFSLLNKTVRNILEYNSNHMDFPMEQELLEAYIAKRLAISLVWSFAGDAKLERRAELGRFISTLMRVEMPGEGSLIDYDVEVGSGDWFSWQSRVPVTELAGAGSATSSDIVIPTIDTIRHEEILYSWLSEHKPLLLCGPPGSGKTMTLFAALRKLPDMTVVDLNFSSATSPELVMRTLEQYCEYRKTPSGVTLSPTEMGRWLVLFCDEINLPAIDNYGTQRIISFLRQLVEQGVCDDCFNF
jgi:dynein heavy chain 1